MLVSTWTSLTGRRLASRFTQVRVFSNLESMLGASQPSWRVRLLKRG